MSIESIRLVREDQSIPWGFRIIGGTDTNLPIIVSKVIEGGVAEKLGLQQDDLLEQINGIPTSGLSHSDVNSIIISSGNQILFQIRRDNLENIILESLNDIDEDNNSEIVNILRQSVINEKNNKQNLEYLETKDLDVKKESEISQSMIIKKDLSKEIESNNICQTGEPKKWSTFLQKPKNPKPKPKGAPPEIPKEQLYKVVIKKQPKKEDKQVYSLEQHEEIVAETQDVKLSNETKDEIKEDILDQALIVGDIETANSCDQTENNEIDEQQLEPTFNIESEVHPSNNEENVVEEIEEIIDNIEVNLQEPVLEINGTSIIDNAPTLEEQLAAVQKQLQELAQLPSSIQETLNMVTQQLATIVSDHKPKDENEDAIEEENVDENFNQICEENQIDEAEPLELTIEDQEQHDIEENDNKEEGQINDEGQAEEQIKDEVQESTEKNLEAQMMDEEKAKKQELVQDEETSKKEFVRPIILPGGRKWCAPDDVCPVLKNPKMSDDKICKTIDMYSEVLDGKTKGINFLKYTPPVKNLDYLQRSEVYRLVHGMEPPVKGISIRSEKIMAEQDYYN